MIGAANIARMLAERIDRLVFDLLPAGHREGQEWRCGSVAGEPGHSLGVHLVGAKRGVWCDFANGQSGDALDLVAGVLGLNKANAIRWAKRWLALENGFEAPPRPQVLRFTPSAPRSDSDPWRKPWANARPVRGTLAEIYLEHRRLAFADPPGDVIRFAASRARRSIHDRPEHHPALLALLRDVRTGEACGIMNIFLHADGSDRLRDAKGKTNTGRASGAAVMLSPFEDVTYGLTICEGLETGLALLADEQAPLWCCGGAGNVSAFPVLSGIEALTIAADNDGPGQRGAKTTAARWQVGGRAALIITPKQNGDWADPRKLAR